MNPFKNEVHKTKRAKMGCVTGSPENFESGADKAERFCRGGYADGGGVGQTGRQMDEDARRTREILERRGIVTPSK